MNEEASRLVHRAERLVRWYPSEWRSRYGDEFVELLVADLSDRPRSWRRATDVAWGGVLARLTDAGLAGGGPDVARRARAGLSSLACASVAFLAVAAAMWSQVTIGWQWSPPDTVATTAAVVVMSAVMLLLVLLVTLAAVPVGSILVCHLVRRRSPGLFKPTLLLVIAAGLLVVGGRHFGNGWPGTGGHPWADQGLVPGGVAAFTWATTLSVSSYWAHPVALLLFPPAEVVWMLLSPLAVVSLVVGAAKILRRLDLPPRVLRYEARLGGMAAGGMLLFIAASCCWVIDGGPGPRGLFHAGAIDVAALIMLSIASAAARRASRQARSAGAALLGY